MVHFVLFPWPPFTPHPCPQHLLRQRIQAPGTGLSASAVCQGGASALVSEGVELQESLTWISCLPKTVFRDPLWVYKGRGESSMECNAGEPIGPYHEKFCVPCNVILLFQKATNSLGITPQNLLTHNLCDGVKFLQIESTSVETNQSQELPRV